MRMEGARDAGGGWEDQDRAAGVGGVGSGNRSWEREKGDWICKNGWKLEWQGSWWERDTMERERMGGQWERDGRREGSREGLVVREDGLPLQFESEPHGSPPVWPTSPHPLLPSTPLFTICSSSATGKSLWWGGGSQLGGLNTSVGAAWGSGGGDVALKETRQLHHHTLAFSMPSSL